MTQIDSTIIFPRISKKAWLRFSETPRSKDRDATFYLRGPWAYRMRSEASQNLEGGLGDANLCSSIETDITGKIYIEIYTSIKNQEKPVLTPRLL